MPATFEIRLVSQVAVIGPKLANLATSYGYTERLLDRARRGLYSNCEFMEITVDWTPQTVRIEF